MIKRESLYRFPKYYELAFCGENTDKFINFIKDVYKKYSPHRELTSILDQGCGTGHILERFIAPEAMLAGYDLAPEMVEYTRLRLKRRDAQCMIFKADLRKFRCPQSFDLSICTGGSFQHLYTHQEVLDNFQCSAAVLKEGGLYIIDLPDPEDFALHPPGNITSKWKVEREGICLNVDFTAHQSPFNWRTQTFTGCAEIEVEDQGLNLSLQLDYSYKVFFLQEIYALVAASEGLEIADILGDYDTDCAYRTAKDPKGMIVVLRKVDKKR